MEEKELVIRETGNEILGKIYVKKKKFLPVYLYSILSFLFMFC